MGLLSWVRERLRGSERPSRETRVVTELVRHHKVKPAEAKTLAPYVVRGELTVEEAAGIAGELRRRRVEKLRERILEREEKRKRGLDIRGILAGLGEEAARIEPLLHGTLLGPPARASGRTRPVDLGVEDVLGLGAAGGRRQRRSRGRGGKGGPRRRSKRSRGRRPS